MNNYIKNVNFYLISFLMLFTRKYTIISIKSKKESTFIDIKDILYYSPINNWQIEDEESSTFFL